MTLFNSLKILSSPCGQFQILSHTVPTWTHVDLVFSHLYMYILTDRHPAWLEGHSILKHSLLCLILSEPHAKSALEFWVSVSLDTLYPDHTRSCTFFVPHDTLYSCGEAKLNKYRIAHKVLFVLLASSLHNFLKCFMRPSWVNKVGVAHFYVPFIQLGQGWKRDMARCIIVMKKELVCDHE